MKGIPRHVRWTAKVVFSFIGLLGPLLFILPFASVAIADYYKDRDPEPKMSMEERVSQANLIVIGKIGSGFYDRRQANIVIEELLFGTLPSDNVRSNNVLHVYYRSTYWLIPGIMSRPDIGMKYDSRWILFLEIDHRLTRDSNYYAYAVGTNQYAHDGFELAGEKTVKQVKELIAKRTAIFEKK